jgi:glycosyltransferase involved in cell wall biosynthesis
MSLYRSATRIVTVTEAFRQNLLSRGIPESKVVTITNGADTDYWQPAPAEAQKEREKLGLQGAFVVLYIGAHGISQALTAQLRAAERLRHDPRVQFVFVGEGAEKEKLVAEARRLGLRNVRFLDPVDKTKVRTYYSLADVCLVPLRAIPLFETFIPSKMFEILSMGCPIIASVRGEAAEILTQSGGALVVPPEDDVAVADAVLKLSTDQTLRTSMAQRGHDFVMKHYSRRELARRYLEVVASARAAYRA